MTAVEQRERDEYMKGVRWKTAAYAVGTWTTIILAIAGAYYGLKADIKDSKSECKEMIAILNKKMDSTQQVNGIQFQKIQDDISAISDRTTVVNHIIHKGSIAGYERWVNGRLTFIPIKSMN